jgi:hypothetical protein
MEGDGDSPDTFLLKRAGMQFCPFNACTFNFKLVYIDTALDLQDKRLLIEILKKICQVSYDVYLIAKRPDMDVMEVVNTVTNAISMLRKTISRCDDALSKLENSTKVLEDRFPSYYEEYKISKNPNLFLENYIIDISQRSEITPKIAGQFRRIMHTMKEKSKTMIIKKPELATLFNDLNEHMDVVEQSYKKDGVTMDDIDGAVDDPPTHTADEEERACTVNNTDSSAFDKCTEHEHEQDHEHTDVTPTVTLGANIDSHHNKTPLEDVD